MFEKPLGLRENPFLAGHHPKYLFPSREHQEALAHLRYGIQNREPFVLITGEVGTGKTTAVYDALAEWGSRAVVALITNSALSRAELLEEICLRFGVNLPSPVSKPQALVELQKRLSEVRGRGELAILLVDEAQNLDRELLEEIRLLSNLEVSGSYLLQIFLVGQPELETNLGQKELRQLRQRIGIHYRIAPLSSTESARYIHHRVSVAGGNAEELFPPDTCVEIFRITNGIPREINIVSGQSLLNAFVDDSRAVTVDHVRAVEREIQFQSVIKKRPDGTVARPARPDPLPAASSTATAETATLPAPAFKVESASAEDEVEEEVSAHAFDEAGVDEESAGQPAAGAGSFDPEAAPEPEPERPETGIRRIEAEAELVLPSWIDEIVQRRQAMEQRMAALSSPQPVAPPASPPPPIPLPTHEPVSIRGQAERAPVERAQAEFGTPSGALLAAPPPERPHPAEPIPLFDHGARAQHLPPRLRHKLTEEDATETETEVAPRRSMLWPIASILIAAVAIGAILMVRFGPWTLQRRAAEPANAPAPTPAPVDTTPRSSIQYPPFDRMNQPGSEFTNRAPGTRQAPATRTEPASRPATGVARPATGAAPGAPPAPATATLAASYGIAVGTFINEKRANAESSRVGQSTDLATRVVTVKEDTLSMYRVVVGSYASRAAAESAASDLVQRGLVTEARVVTVSRP